MRRAVKKNRILLLCVVLVGVFICACQKDKIGSNNNILKKTHTGLYIDISNAGLNANTNAEDKINKLRIISFGSLASNIGEVLDTNQLFRYEGSSISTGVSSGSRNIYVIANEPDPLLTTFSSIQTESELNKIAFTYDGEITAPLVALAIHKDVKVGMSEGDVNVLRSSLKRVATKLIVKINCPYADFFANGGDSEIRVKSVKVKDLPTEYYFMPDSTYQGSDYIDSKPLSYINNISATPRDNFKGEAVFLMPEYILKENSSNQSYIELVLEMASDPNITSTYNIPIGNPAGMDKEGSLIRNKAYTYNVTIKNLSSSVDPITVNCSVDDWEDQLVNGDIGLSWINLSCNSLEVDLLLHEEISFYAAQEVTVGFTNNRNKFSAELRYSNAEKTSGKIIVEVPKNERVLSGTDTLLIKSGAIIRKIPLKIYNRVSLSVFGANSTYTWNEAAGYSNPYQTPDGQTVDPNKVAIDQSIMAPNANTGCRRIVTNSNDNGEGEYRLPTYEECNMIRARIEYTGNLGIWGEDIFGRNGSTALWTTTHASDTSVRFINLYEYPNLSVSKDKKTDIIISNQGQPQRLNLTAVCVRDKKIGYK